MNMAAVIIPLRKSLANRGTATRERTWMIPSLACPSVKVFWRAQYFLSAPVGRVVPLPIYTEKHHDIFTSTSHRRLIYQKFQFSGMASSTNPPLIMVNLMFMQIIASAALVKGQVIPGLTITVENEFVGAGQKLDLHCTLNGKDLGQQSLMPFNRFVHKFDTSFFGNDLFTCTLATAGKLTTTIDVFKGFSYAHRPCECLGMHHCFWQVLNEGFWCNSKFIQNWG